MQVRKFYFREGGWDVFMRLAMRLSISAAVVKITTTCKVSAIFWHLTCCLAKQCLGLRRGIWIIQLLYQIFLAKYCLLQSSDCFILNFSSLIFNLSVSREMFSSQTWEKQGIQKQEPHLNLFPGICCQIVEWRLRWKPSAVDTPCAKCSFELGVLLFLLPDCTAGSGLCRTHK